MADAAIIASNGDPRALLARDLASIGATAAMARALAELLRPADTVPLGAEGVILSRRPSGYWGIKFDKGSFLVDGQFLEQTETSADQATEAAD